MFPKKVQEMKKNKLLSKRLARSIFFIQRGNIFPNQPIIVLKAYHPEATKSLNITMFSCHLAYK